MTETPDPVPPTPEPGADTASGLQPNVAGALAYLLGPITGILFLLIEKRSPFVRFHAAQSIGISMAFILLSIVLSILTTVLTVIPVIGIIISIVMVLASIALAFVGLGLWLFLMYQAFQGKEWEFPWVGAQSRRMLLSGQPPTI